jgi:hypothetical protein
MTKKTEQRGGPRPNSGRPPKDNARIPAPMRLPPDTVAFLRQSGQTLAEATELIVRRSKAFREWQRKNKKHSKKKGR